MKRDRSTDVEIPAGTVVLRGVLSVPKGAQGMVLFAHGSGSGRLSPRNRFVAGALERVGLATLLFDLLTGNEEKQDVLTAEYRFDIPLLTERLIGATDWSRGRTVPPPAVGYFGASTGAAAALAAAAARPEAVAAVVSRGGRPDLADAGTLRKVTVPTLLIVGEDDPDVLELNRRALSLLASECKELVVVPRAGHLFEEPGTLERVAVLAAAWFADHLGAPGRRPKTVVR